jgi:hypothetical protein
MIFHTNRPPKQPKTAPKTVLFGRNSRDQTRYSSFGIDVDKVCVQPENALQRNQNWWSLQHFHVKCYRTHAAEWLFHQEKATLHADAMSAREAKMLQATAFELTRPSGIGDPSRTFLGIAILVPL